MTTQELVERLRADADFIDADTYDECWEIKETPRGKVLRAAASRLSEMEGEIKRLREALRNLCASLDRLGDNGVYVIDTGLAHAYAASLAALEQQQKGEEL